MAHAEWLLDGVLILLLAATLFHALRLERALGVLKRDRAVLEDLVSGFNESTRQAESGIDRLRAAADGAGRQIARQIDQAQLLRDDLKFLADRSDTLAQRLEAAVRAARLIQDVPLPIAADPVAMPTHAAAGPPKAPVAARGAPRPRAVAADEGAEPGADGKRLRSQAERDLLRALRGNR